MKILHRLLLVMLPLAAFARRISVEASRIQLMGLLVTRQEDAERRLGLQKLREAEQLAPTGNDALG